jgi:hypothetical protein
MNTNTNPVNDIARQVLNQWRAAFNRADWAGLNKLYTTSAQLFGGKPALYAGSARILEYFSVLEPGYSVSFDEPAVVQPLNDVVTLATTANFVCGGEPLPYRLSFTLVREGAAWLIAAHHASPRAPL